MLTAGGVSRILGGAKIECLTFMVVLYKDMKEVSRSKYRVVNTKAKRT